MSLILSRQDIAFLLYDRLQVDTLAARERLADHSPRIGYDLPRVMAALDGLERADPLFLDLDDAAFSAVSAGRPAHRPRSASRR